MKLFRVPVGRKNAYFDAYIQEKSPSLLYSDKRPLMVVVPGGAYHTLSFKEGETLGLGWSSRGYQILVLYYSVADEGKFPDSLIELAETVAWARQHAEEYWIDPEKIFVNGSSAGGHLAASLGVYWNTPFLRELTGLSSELMQPNRLVLCYPVISGLEHGHHRSVKFLMGEDTPETEEAFSLETKVNKDVPPCYIWSTYTDANVPVENSLLFANALCAARIPFELHIFSEGTHGMVFGLRHTQKFPDRGYFPYCAKWIDMANDWLEREAVYEPY